MVRKIILLMYIVTALMLVNSCSNSSTPIHDLESLIERIDQESYSYTDEDWENIAAEYSAIEDELLKYEYTDEEIKEIGRLQGKYLGKVAKSALKDFRDIMDVLQKQIEGGVEGFMEELEGIEDWEDL